MDFDITGKLMVIPGIIIGLAFHEFAHAKAADMLGDPTPRSMGRVTLDPIVHIDILGFIMLIIAGFGWGKPVVVNPGNYGNPRRDEIIVSAAGPVMNLIIAAALLIILKIIFIFQISFFYSAVGEIIIKILESGVWINIVLMVFNLIPIPPLDGFNIFSEIFNLRGKGIYYQLYDKGQLILLILIITNLSGKILGPPVMFIYDTLVNIFF